MRRYERELLSPIHRSSGKFRTAVVAKKNEQDGRGTSSSAQGDSLSMPWLAYRTNRLGANFLQIDSEIALTFSGLALQARNEERRKRTIRTARIAYDTIMRLREGIDLSNAEQRKLDANLKRLKRELRNFGQTF
jgi:hypothetical protein